MFDDVTMFVDQARVGFAACAVTAEALGGQAESESLGEMLAGLERARRAADAAELAVIAELARREADPVLPGETRLAKGEVAPFCADEVALLLGCSLTVAQRRCRLAARLATDLSDLAVPLSAGLVGERSVQLIASETEDASAEGVAAVVAHVLGRKRGSEEVRLVALEPRELARSCRRVLTVVDEAALERRARRNRAEATDVHLDPGPVGTSMLTAVMPTEAAVVVYAAVEELARTAVRDRPGLRLGSARAQALTDLALRGVSVHTRLDLTVPVLTGPAPAGGGEGCAGGEGDPSQSHPALAPAGGGEERAGDGTAPQVGARFGPVEVPGAGWIPAETVAAIRAGEDHDLARVLLDPDTGHLVAVDTAAQPGYVPRPGLRRLVTTRDGTCRMFGCTRPAISCDLDHATAWPHGPTSAANLAPLCRRHHRLKQHPAWGYRLDPDGTATWTSPTGATAITWPQAWGHEANNATPPPPAGASPAAGAEPQTADHSTGAPDPSPPRVGASAGTALAGDPPPF